MSKVWIFFKLRMLQLRYDKTALFFSYVLPVLLLMGIGYPMEMAGKATVEVHYSDQLNNAQSKQLLSRLSAHHLLSISRFDGSEGSYQESLRDNQVDHFLLLSPDEGAGEKAAVKVKVQLFAADSNEQQMQSKAIAAIVGESLGTVASGSHSGVVTKTIAAASMSSYIVTLLPGLIGMTLLIVGLNGFGSVLIGEAHAGLFKNIKTIDASPLPFLSGLLLSRLVVCYTVSLALYLVGILMFDLTADIDYLLLFVVLTLGCVSFLGLGLMLAVLSPSVAAFSGIVNFIQIPFVVFSGVFFSTAAFPGWLQGITGAIPLAQMVTGLRAVFFEQAGMANIGDLSLPLLVMAIWCVVTLVIGWKKFSW